MILEFERPVFGALHIGGIISRMSQELLIPTPDVIRETIAARKQEIAGLRRMLRLATAADSVRRSRERVDRRKSRDTEVADVVR